MRTVLGCWLGLLFGVLLWHGFRWWLDIVFGLLLCLGLSLVVGLGLALCLCLGLGLGLCLGWILFLLSWGTGLGIGSFLGVCNRLRLCLRLLVGNCRRSPLGHRRDFGLSLCEGLCLRLLLCFYQ